MKFAGIHGHHSSSNSLTRRFRPKRNDEKPRRSNVSTFSVPVCSAIQTSVAAEKSIGVSAYLFVRRTEVARPSKLKQSHTSVALASRKEARLAGPCWTSERK